MLFRSEPIALAFIYGMHGIIMDADNPMVSRDSIGGIETAVEEDFDKPVVVMHLQGSGGDASPRGSDRDFARMETIGEFGHQAIYDLCVREFGKDKFEPMDLADVWAYVSKQLP